MRNLSRTGLYLLFIILIALPLLPGLRAADNESGSAWTEPGGALSEELAKQRRQLISEEIGIIDLQQPGSVALVSFDFTPATQGEMQPLAEAIIGRLRGQGMRLIFMSLEPEGAALAQQMANQLLTERAEPYGQDLVNLGYLPGQIAGIRQLSTGETSLADLHDFEQGLTFASPELATWQTIKNLEQINVIVTLSDNPVTARWWIEQLALVPKNNPEERLLLAATSATAAPFLQPYRASHQLDGLIAGINGAAAIEAGRQEFGPARQMLDSQSIAHFFIIILMAAGTVVGWMPPLTNAQPDSETSESAPETIVATEEGE
jgi:hypothetical protein